MKLSCVLLTAALCAPGAALADWRSIASAGFPDESCAGRYVFSGAVASLASKAPSCVLRYPVNIGPSFGSGGLDDYTISQVWADVYDNGPDARVLVRLMENGKEITRIDSNDRVGSPEWQSRGSGCVPVYHFQRHYWVEVTLSRSTKFGRAAVGPMASRFSNCDSN